MSDKGKKTKCFTLDPDVADKLESISSQVRRSESSLVNEILAEKLGIIKWDNPWTKK